MNADDRLEELVVAYLRGEAGEEDLREISRLLAAGDETSRRLARMISDGTLIAGWFRADSDPNFAAEAAAAARTERDDPEFVARTLDRIDHGSRRARRAAGPKGTPGWIFVLAAAALIAFAALVAGSLSRPAPRRNGAPVAVESPAPPPQPPAPAPEERRAEPAPRPEPAPPAPIPTPEPRRPEPPPPAPPALPASEPPRPAPRPALPETRPAPVVLIARLERVQGRVELGRSPARAGDQVPSGSALETLGRDALAVLRYADGTRLEMTGPARIGELSERAAEGAAGGGKRLFLESGTISLDVPRQAAGHPLVVQTPHGRVRVLGTRFTVAAAADSTRVEVKEGRVLVTRTEDGASVEVAKDHYALVSNGPALSSRPIVPEAFGLKDIPVAGLSLWLRADLGVTLDGGVSAWADQSPQRRNAAQSDPARRPAFVPEAVAGRPSLRFDGVDDHLAATLPVAGLTGLTLFLVAANARDRMGGPNHGESAALFWEETAQWGWVYLSPFQSNVKFRFGTTQAGNLPFYLRDAPIGSAFTLTVSQKDGTHDSLFVQGVPVVRETGKLAAIRGTTDALTIGKGTTCFPGEIAEILVYSRALGEAERQRVERLLLQKYFPKR
jgi:ferric-dicitrate binding protein FerR (iron transport regulator)